MVNVTLDEVRRMAAQIDPKSPFGLRDKAILALATHTALRVSEIAGLCVHDVAHCGRAAGHNRQRRALMKVGLVSCVSSKLAIAAPAEDLYTSPLFMKARRWAETHYDQWYILSAKHGLIDPDAIVEPYNVSLKDPGTDRTAWAKSVYRQMQDGGLIRSDIQIVWLAGSAYKKELALIWIGFMPFWQPSKPG